LIENQEIVIGTVKTLAPKYGITTLVKAFYEAKRKVSNHDLDIANKMRLRIVGDGPQLNEINDLIKDLNLNSITKITGTIPNDKVPNELRNFDIYCAFSESESESFGVAIIEASACGIPVIVNKIGGLTEVTIDKITGIQVEKGNIHEASEAILKLVLNKELRLDMGKSGRDFVLNNFEWEDNVDYMVNILQQGHDNFSFK
jgi:glycosyltransferase involved in cell wall biosynthesis